MRGQPHRWYVPARVEQERRALERQATALERRPRAAHEVVSWPAWFAAMHNIDFENPPFADGRHLRRA